MPSARRLLVASAGSAVVLWLTLLHSSDVSGDTATPAPVGTVDTPTPGFGAPYEFGPGAILYSDADASLRADADSVRQRTEAGQGVESSLAFSAAASQAASDAQAEIAVRQIGLDGASDQGVVP